MQNVDKAFERPPLSRYVLQFVLLFQIFSFSFEQLAAIISESATNHCTSYIPQGFIQSPLTRHASENRENKATKYEFIHEFISVMLKLPNGICTDTSAFTDTNEKYRPRMEVAKRWRDLCTHLIGQHCIQTEELDFRK